MLGRQLIRPVKGCVKVDHTSDLFWLLGALLLHECAGTDGSIAKEQIPPPDLYRCPWATAELEELL